MSISFSNTNIEWSDLFKYKREWLLILGIGYPLVILYNFWLYAPQITDWSVIEKIRFSYFVATIDVSWCFVFGFISGLVSFKADFIIQLMMSYIGAYLLYFSSSIFNTFVSFNFLISWFLIFVYISVSFLIGWTINHFIDKKILKTHKKEIDERGYVDYRQLS